MEPWSKAKHILATKIRKTSNQWNPIRHIFPDKTPKKLLVLLNLQACLAFLLTARASAVDQLVVFPNSSVPPRCPQRYPLAAASVKKFRMRNRFRQVTFLWLAHCTQCILYYSWPNAQNELIAFSWKRERWSQMTRCGNHNFAKKAFVYILQIHKQFKLTLLLLWYICLFCLARSINYVA